MNCMLSRHLINERVLKVFASQNLRLEWTYGDCVILPCTQKKASYCRFPRIMCNDVFAVSKDRDLWT